jgi:hypothetical protein
LNYLKTEKLAVILVLIASLIMWHIIPLPERVIFGYAITLIGFGIIFFREGHRNLLSSYFESAS